LIAEIAQLGASVAAAAEQYRRETFDVGIVYIYNCVWLYDELVDCKCWVFAKKMIGLQQQTAFRSKFVRETQFARVESHNGASFVVVGWRYIHQFIESTYVMFDVREREREREKERKRERKRR
jgi:hypothetical protein